LQQENLLVIWTITQTDPVGFALPTVLLLLSSPKGDLPLPLLAPAQNKSPKVGKISTPKKRPSKHHKSPRIHHKLTTIYHRQTRQNLKNPLQKRHSTTKNFFLIHNPKNRSV
jgi:hypothetical protein